MDSVQRGGRAEITVKSGLYVWRYLRRRTSPVSHPSQPSLPGTTPTVIDEPAPRTTRRDPPQHRPLLQVEPPVPLSRTYRVSPPLVDPNTTPTLRPQRRRSLVPNPPIQASSSTDKLSRFDGDVLASHASATSMNDLLSFEDDTLTPRSSTSSANDPAGFDGDSLEYLDDEEGLEPNN